MYGQHMPYVCAPKVQRAKIMLEDCERKALCDPLRSLISDWSVDFIFPPDSNLNITSFQAVGLFSKCHKEIDSVAQKYLVNVSRPPTFADLNGARIKIQIPGIKGSTCIEDTSDRYPYDVCGCNVEVYFLGQGDEVGKYTAILKAELLSTGNEMVCRVRQIENEADPDRPIDLIFVALLRYIEQPVKSALLNTFQTPPPFGEMD